jgi:hypothetical protein
MRVAPKCEINPAVRIFLQTRSHRGRNAKHQVHKEDGIMADNRESGGGSNAAVVAIVVIFLIIIAAAIFFFGGQFTSGGGGTKKVDVNVKAPAVPGKSP